MQARAHQTAPAERPTRRARPAASGTRRPNTPVLQRCSCGGHCPRCRHNDDGDPLFQPRLRITPPADRYEREADRTAETVLRGEALAPTPRISPLLQRHGPDTGTPHPPTLAADLDRLRPHGRALPEAERRYFEPRFGRDFAGVRLHTGAEAERLASSVDAHAFASGRDLVFGAGQYRPGTRSGRRLLAHELTHVVQQGAAGATPAVQRQGTNPSRSAELPVYFPPLRKLVRVYSGQSMLKAGDKHLAVGLVQQALVDLGYDLGTTGPNNDGVDKHFGETMERAVRAFQVDQGLQPERPGEVDQATLRRLDEVRGRRAATHLQEDSIPPGQFLIGDPAWDVNDPYWDVVGIPDVERPVDARSVQPAEDIYFEQGSARLTPKGLDKIVTLALRYSGRRLTLYGYISEDERLNPGPLLATRRAEAVQSILADYTTKNTPLPDIRPMPDASMGVPNYRARRKVEVVDEGSTPRTPHCGWDAPTDRPLTEPERDAIDEANRLAIHYLSEAEAGLAAGGTPGSFSLVQWVLGRVALRRFFGDTQRRRDVLEALREWRSFLQGHGFAADALRGTGCDTICALGRAAYNRGDGMTFCGLFFEDQLADLYAASYGSLSPTDGRAFVLLHEAGHYELDLEDVAYGNRRLFRYIQEYPDDAFRNTDSYTRLVLCVAGLQDACTLFSNSGPVLGFDDAAERSEAMRAVAWLQSWIEWSAQSLFGLYKYLKMSRTEDLHWTNYDQLLDLLDVHFGHRRPRHARSTTRDLTVTAALHDRYRRMKRATGFNVTIEKADIDRNASPIEVHWRLLASPDEGAHLQLGDAFFSLPLRAQVERLLERLVEAVPDIDASVYDAYAGFTRDLVDKQWGGQPA